MVVRTAFVIPTLRYDTLDASGAAATAGSHAFLARAGYAASAIGDSVYRERVDPVELRIHPTDASGTAREGLYDAVRVGDSLDYRMRDFDCGIRLRVTNIGAATSPRTFGVEYVAEHGRRCGLLRPARRGWPGGLRVGRGRSV